MSAELHFLKLQSTQLEIGISKMVMVLKSRLSRLETMSSRSEPLAKMFTEILKICENDGSVKLSALKIELEHHRAALQQVTNALEFITIKYSSSPAASKSDIYVDELRDIFNEMRSSSTVKTSQSDSNDSYLEELINTVAHSSDESPQDRILKAKELTLLKKLIPVVASRGHQSTDDVTFDESIDDQETLVHFFRQVDANRDHHITMEEMIQSEALQSNPEVARVVMRSLALDFEALQEALSPLQPDDFGHLRGETHDESLRRLYMALLPHDADPAPGTSRGWLCKVDLLAFLHAEPNTPIRLRAALESLAENLPGPGRLDFVRVKQAVGKVPRVAGQRVAWVRGLGLDTALARHLPAGTLRDNLAGLRAMTEADLDRAWAAFAAEARRQLHGAAARLRDARGSASAHEANSKFAMDQRAFTGAFAGLADFHAGAEASLALGYPNPDVEHGMRQARGPGRHMRFWACVRSPRQELTAHPAAWRPFSTPNYRITTCLALEYWWIVDPDAPPPEVLRHLRTRYPPPSQAAIASPSKEVAALYPGEVGNGYSEAVVMLALPAAWRGQLEAAGLVVRLRAAGVMQGEEEAAWGVQVWSADNCARHEARAAAPLVDEATVEAAAARRLAELEAAGLRPAGLVLPVPAVRAEASMEGILHAVTAAADFGDDAHRVQLLPPAAENAGADGRGFGPVWQRDGIYCDYPDARELRRALNELSDTLLELEAQNTWGIDPAAALAVDCGDSGADAIDAEGMECEQPVREELVRKVVNAFVRRELRAEVELALRRAPAAALAALESAWGVSPAAGPAERAAALAEAVNSEERYAGLTAWLGLFRRRIHGRRRVSLEVLLERKRERVARFGLLRGEVLALRFYTGPGFVPVNCVCRRGFPHAVAEALRGEGVVGPNKLPTTIFTITSGLLKLGRHTELPERGRVYRGLGHMLLPREFWVPHGQPAWRGGVERAFTSTTTDKEVALFYSGGRGMVAEVAVSRIQIGGDLSWISMYPGEKEITFAPFTCFEADGEPRVEASENGEVVVFPLKASVNPRASTVEELRGRRKTMHLGAARLLWEDLQLQAALACDDLLAYVTSGRRRGLLQLLCTDEGVEADVIIDEREGIIEFRDSTTPTSLVAADDLPYRVRKFDVSDSDDDDEGSSGEGSSQPKTRNVRALVGAPLLGRKTGKIQFELEVLEAPPHSHIQVVLMGMEAARRPVEFARFGPSQVRRVTIKDSNCKYIHSSGSSGGSFPDKLVGWTLPGSVLGVACDLDARSVSAALIRLAPLPPDDGQPKKGKSRRRRRVPSPGSDWIPLSRFGMGGEREDPADAGFFPSVLASAGVRLRLRFGLPTEASPPPFVESHVIADGSAAVVTAAATAKESETKWGLLMRPASEAHRPLGEQVAAGVLGCARMSMQTEQDMSKLLDDLGIGPAKLSARLEAVRAAHESLQPEEFNSDTVYLNKLDEIVTTKAGLIRQQELLIEFLKLGADPALLVALCRDAPEAEFATCHAALDHLAPFDWCQVWWGDLTTLEKDGVILVPIDLPSCMASVVWYGLLANRKDWRNRLVSIGGEPSRQLDDFVPTLNIKKLGLHLAKFERAVLGLIKASSVLSAKDASGEIPVLISSESGDEVPRLTAVDMQGLEYNRQGLLRVADAVGAAAVAGHLLTVNQGLVVKDQQDRGIRSCLVLPNQEDSDSDSEMAGGGLDLVSFRVVISWIRHYGWSTIDFSKVAFKNVAGAEFGASLQLLTNMTCLRICELRVDSSWWASLGTTLSYSPWIQELHFDWNDIGKNGLSTLAPSFANLTSLRVLHLRAISQHEPIGVPGSRMFAAALPALTNLTELNLSMNGLGSAGLAILRTGPLRQLTLLKKLSVGRNMVDEAEKAAVRQLLEAQASDLDVSSSDDSDNS